MSFVSNRLYLVRTSRVLVSCTEIGRFAKFDLFEHSLMDLLPTRFGSRRCLQKF